MNEPKPLPSETKREGKMSFIPPPKFVTGRIIGDAAEPIADPTADPKNLVERLLSGKPTPLEREAGEALASLADELRLAQERVAELEKLIVRIADSGHLFGRDTDLDAACCNIASALKDSRS